MTSNSKGALTGGGGGSSSRAIHAYERESGERVVVVATTISASRCVVAVEIDGDLAHEEILKGARPDLRAKLFAVEYERDDREIYARLLASNTPSQGPIDWAMFKKDTL